MPRIEELFTFVAEDKGPDDEGIVAMPFISQEGSVMMPLVGADMSRIKSLRPWAEEIKRRTGKSVKLLRFSSREVLEEI